MADIKSLTVWSIEDLGPTVGLLNPAITALATSGIYAVNDDGVAVGEAAVEWLGGSYRWHAFLIDTAIRDIHPTGARSSYAKDINADGWIVGGIMTPAGESYAYCRSPMGVMSTLAAPSTDGREVALAIARSGQVVGQSHGHAMSWGPPIPDPTTAPISLHDENYVTSEPSDVNDAGQVVGYFGRPSMFTPVGAVYTGGSWTLVPTPTSGWSKVRRINTAGTAVGEINPPVGAMGGSSMFEIDSGVLTLLPDHWPTLRAYAGGWITDDGEIFGNGAYIVQPGLGSWTPITYTKSAGLLRLDRFLPLNSGWELRHVSAVSPSGWVVVGTGRLNSEERFYRMKRSVKYWPIPILHDVPHGWPAMIFGQVRSDGGGGILTPTGVSPVPPWGVTPGMGEVLRSLALNEMVGQLSDAELRRAIQPLLLGHAEQWLGRMRELSAIESAPRELKRVRQPSRLVLPNKRLPASGSKKGRKRRG